MAAAVAALRTSSQCTPGSCSRLARAVKGSSGRRPPTRPAPARPARWPGEESQRCSWSMSGCRRAGVVAADAWGADKATISEVTAGSRPRCHSSAADHRWFGRKQPAF